ncbi:MAG: hypothetical protein KIS94_14760 [Chitinophagales bacterium]|nr:hypothetical protein [Chitinophagales bacterium]
MNKDEKTLHYNKFFLAVLEAYVRDYIAKIASKSQFDEKSLYVKAVYERLENIKSSSERLNFSLFFLSDYTPKVSFKRNNLSRQKYYDYHLAIFYTIITSYSDQTILLVNDVFNLGLNEHEATRSTVIENKHCPKAIQQSFRELENVLTNEYKLKKIRNHFVHRGVISNKDFEEIASDIAFGETMKELKLIDKTPAIDALSMFFNKRGKESLKMKVSDLNSIKQKIELKVIDTHEHMTETFEAIRAKL